MAMRCQQKGLDPAMLTFADNSRSSFSRRDFRVEGAPQYVLLIFLR